MFLQIQQTQTVTVPCEPAAKGRKRGTENGHVENGQSPVPERHMEQEALVCSEVHEPATTQPILAALGHQGSQWLGGRVLYVFTRT